MYELSECGTRRQDSILSPADHTLKELLVGALYDMKLAIESKIKSERLDAAAIKGQIGLRTGRVLSLISVNTLDDPAAEAKLRQAAKEVLNLRL